MANTFSTCSHFNQPVTIPNSVTNMASTFSSCYNFNQPVTILDGVTNMPNTFYYCSNFNQPVTIPDGVTNMISTFSYCNNFNQPVYFHNSLKLSQTTTKNMFGGVHDNSLIRSIYCDNATPFLGTALSNSITGTAVTWSALPDGNGYYNALYNIYIYNNWTPT